MVESPELTWALVMLFLPGALHGLQLCARAWSAAPDRLGPDDKPIAFAHLAMSLAMIAMVHMWGGSSAYDVQVVVFVGLGGYFLLRTLGVLRLGSTDHCSLGYHALMCAAMVWMFAAMTDMTGHRWVEGAGGHEGHGGAGAAGGSAAVDPPDWMVVVTLVFAVALTVVLVAWLTAARSSAPVPVPVGAPAPLPTAQRCSEPGHTVDPISAATHVLLSAGMIAMLLMMI